jgi:SP family arabinose:H+ symporter-like MFS transporter
MRAASRPPDLVKEAGGAYPFLISFVAAVGGFLFGYDLVIIGGANPLLRDEFHLSGAALGLVTASAQLGCIGGPFLSAWFCDRVGRRNTLIFSALLFGISAIMTAIPKEIVTFCIFRFVGGVGVGFCSIASPMYITEVAPARIRGRLGLMYQMAIVAGVFTSGIVAYFLAKHLVASLSWRWMFASEMLPIIGFVILLALVPRSPRWLAEKGRFEEALTVLTRIEGNEYARQEMAEIKESIAEDTGSFSELLEPGLKTALVVGICLALFNNLTGWTAMSFYIPILFQKGGHPEIADSILQFVIVTAWAGILTLVSIYLVDLWGRRPLWIAGSASMVVALILAGVVFQFNLTGSIVLLVIFLCAAPHAMALGPLPWLMMSELYPTRIRAKALSITTTILWVAAFIGTYAFPVFCEYSEKRIGSVGGAFWVFALICVLSLVYGLKWLPETKGKTLEEIAKSWKRA